jgi:hypothetical protein
LKDTEIYCLKDHLIIIGLDPSALRTFAIRMRMEMPLDLARGTNSSIALKRRRRKRISSKAWMKDYKMHYLMIPSRICQDSSICFSKSR